MSFQAANASTRRPIATGPAEIEPATRVRALLRPSSQIACITAHIRAYRDRGACRAARNPQVEHIHRPLVSETAPNAMQKFEAIFSRFYPANHGFPAPCESHWRVRFRLRSKHSILDHGSHFSSFLALVPGIGG